MDRTGRIRTERGPASTTWPDKVCAPVVLPGTPENRLDKRSLGIGAAVR
jgi:hypothetical protein